MIMKEDDLKRYIQQHNAENEVHKPVPSVSPPVRKPGGRKSVTWIYIEQGIPHFLFLLFLSFFASLVIFSLAPNPWYYAAVVVALLIPIVFWLAGLVTYIRWTKGAYYPMHGWQELIAKRSPDFWKGKTYTPVTIRINLQEPHTPLSKEAAVLFLKQWDNQWNRRYSKMDWQPGSGIPKDLIANGLVLAGHISARSMVHINSQLCKKFIPLARMLGGQLKSVEIVSEEREYYYHKVKYSRNAYDRQSGGSHSS
jgi:hypothetical protein